jgi:beta-glucosidase
MPRHRFAYHDRSLPVKQRVNDLLSRMSIQEKCMQLGAIYLNDVYDETTQSVREDECRVFARQGWGHFGRIGHHLSADASQQLYNELQRTAVEDTRLGIPVIVHEECLHGCMARGSTSFPQAIALASTWDTSLMHRVATAIGKEAYARGINQALSPTINMARDKRCGRTEETYGEDPLLTSRMVVAFVQALQAQHVIATPKHFVANFVGDGGRDSNDIHISERLLREVYFPPFKAAVQQAGALSLMSAYNTLDGVPCSANAWLLTDVLRREWGFTGYVVSDYNAVADVHHKHCTALDPADAALQCFRAGLDLELPRRDCVSQLMAHAEEDPATWEKAHKIIDENVRHILYVKFATGLFDAPYSKKCAARTVVHCDAHKALSLETARKSIVLLKNNGDTLPLPKDIARLAVVGPHIHKLPLGGYPTVHKEPEPPLAAVTRLLGESCTITHAQGCSIKMGTPDTGSDTPVDTIEDAVEAAKTAEAVLVFAGNSNGDGYKEAGNNTEGEECDRCMLELPGQQEELIRRVAHVNDNVVVVVLTGTAVIMTSWIDRVAAVVHAWYPGEYGSEAIVDILTGTAVPRARLPLSIPRHTGQLPLYYNPKPSGRVFDYYDCRGEETQALFPFGYGLSYTTFSYDNLSVRKTNDAEGFSVHVQVDITNTGPRAGVETAQCYIRDCYSSYARAVKELKDWQQVELKPGETTQVHFDLTRKDFEFLGHDLRPVFEAGAFDIMVGPDSGTVHTVQIHL